MNMTDELERLSKLHKDGALSDEEFALAKSSLFSDSREKAIDHGHDDSLGRAANRYVTLQTVMAVIGIIIFLIVLFGIILPQFSSHTNTPPMFHIQPGR